MLEFEWDLAKARQNLQKHGISFEEAKSVFYDEYARIIADNSHSEERFVILGMSEGLKVLVVVHCYRSEATTIRIIYACKATKKEQNQYEEQK